MTCAVAWCLRSKARDSIFCIDHLGDAWANRIEKLPDGSYRVLADRTPEWVRRAREHRLTAKVLS